MAAGTVDRRDELDHDVVRFGTRLIAPRRGRALRDRLVTSLLDDQRLRDALFRVVDVAPACDTPEDLAAHFRAFIDGTGGPRGRVATLARAGQRPIPQRTLGRLIEAGVRRVARRFIVAETVDAANRPLGRLWEAGVAVTVDLLGEASVSTPEADAYAARCGDALGSLAAAAEGWPERPLLDRDSVGRLSRVNLSIKPTALTPFVHPDAPERGYADLADRLRPLLRRARDLGAHLHVDMESVDTRELTLAVTLDLLAEPEFADGPSTGLVIQAYLRDSEDVLDHVLERVGGMGRSVPPTIRLVKGAYWDHETIKAIQHGWTPPVWSHKHESDRCFERLARRLVDAFPIVRPAIASHNVRSIADGVVYARRSGLGPADLEVQVLRGLGDDLAVAVAAEGVRVRTYCPVGDLVAGMGYLVRRLLENSSNESFLVTQKRGVPPSELLERP